MSKVIHFSVSDFYCTECGKAGIPIPRNSNAMRNGGHLKNLFCLYCGKSTNHVEVSKYHNYSVENFKEEFELGRFVDGNRVAIKDLKGCKNHDCKYNKNGKCWNAQKENCEEVM